MPSNDRHNRRVRAARAFTPEIITGRGQWNNIPIVYCFSNPTSQSECTAQTPYHYTNGHAVFASGSPFPRWLSMSRQFVPGRANKCLCIFRCRARRYGIESTRYGMKVFRGASGWRIRSSGKTWNWAGFFPSLSAFAKCLFHIAIAVARLVFAGNSRQMKQPSRIYQDFH